MKYINDYGKQIIKDFLDKCKADGTYKRVFVDYEDGLCLLDPSVKNAKDCASLFLLNYDEDAINVVGGWQKETEDNVAWYGDGFNLTYDEVITELEKSITETE